MNTHVGLRPALPADLPFIGEMLFEAFFWRAEQPRPALEAFAASNTEYAKLLRDWGREGDLALIAEVEGIPAGAGWYRLWTAEEHSYGFVDENTPELGLGVKQGYRHQGIGRALLQGLVERASEAGYEALSLSVEPDNFSRQLYESEGFAKVGENGGAWTMVRRL